MGKGAGGTRLLGAPKPKSHAYFTSERKRLGTLDNNIDYYNWKTGGFVIWQEGHKHANEGRKNDEFRFAKELARHGYGVYLLPEDAKNGGISFRLSAKGGSTFSDAKVGTYYYEQTTKKSDNAKYGVLSALQHAGDKGIKLAAIYDKYGSLSRLSIQKGIDWYEHNRGKKGSGLIKLDGVLVVNKNHELYWHDMRTSENEWWEKK